MPTPTSAAAPASFEGEFQFLADFVPQLVWITDPSGDHRYFNRRWTDYTGYSVAESLGPEIWNTLLHPDDQARARQVWGHSLASGADYDIEYRLRGKDGAFRWFLGSARPRRDPQTGQIVAWFGTCTDIHDQKVAEEQLQQREAEFTTLVDNMAQLAWLANPDGHIYWYNRGWYAYTGTTPAAMEGWGWQSVHDPQELPRVLEGWRGSIAAGQPFEMVFPLRGADGQYRTFLTRAAPLKGAAGRVLRWIGTNTDVTELRELQEQLEAANRDLEAKIVFRTLELEHQLQELKSRR